MSCEESCCPSGSWGSLPASADDNKYEAKGEEVKLRDGELLAYYVTDGSASGKVVMVFTDVWGITPRVKGICDKLAADLKCTVIMPDILRGETMGPDKNFFKWIAQYPFDALIKGDLDACTEFLLSKQLFSPTSSTIGCLGFCWGAWVVAKTLSTPPSEDHKWSNLLKCGVGLHPSTHVEASVFKQDEEKMILDIPLPLLLCTAGNDKANLKAGSPLVTHMESKGGKSVDYPDMIHGWVARGDFSKENVLRDANDALGKTVDHFSQNL